MWSATAGATCLVKADGASGSRYASPERPDLGKDTIPAATFTEKGPYSLFVMCRKTLVVKPGPHPGAPSAASVVVRMERKDLVTIQ